MLQKDKTVQAVREAGCKQTDQTHFIRENNLMRHKHLKQLSDAQRHTLTAS